MVNGKVLSVDMFPCKFYYELWDMVMCYLHKFYQEVLVFDSLVPITNKGNIKLIPK